MLGDNLSITNIITVLLVVFLVLILCNNLKYLKDVNESCKFICNTLKEIDSSMTSCKEDTSAIRSKIDSLSTTMDRIERRYNNQEESSINQSYNQSESDAHDGCAVENDIINDNDNKMSDKPEINERNINGGINDPDSSSSEEDVKKTFLKNQKNLFKSGKLVETDKSSMYVRHEDGNSFRGYIDESCLKDTNPYSGYRDDGILTAFDIVDTNDNRLVDSDMKNSNIRLIQLIEPAKLRQIEGVEEYSVTQKGKLKVEVIKNR